ncbi:MAG TPA: trehalose-6-phosphate synthase [bacterium]
MEIKRLVIVSNRLPVVVGKDDNGKINFKKGSGGLVTAVSPVLKDKGGIWIGWQGCDGTPDIDELLNDAGTDTGYMLKSVNISKTEINHYYYGFSNEILWPLFHDLPDRCNFNPGYFNYYKTVNRKFADVIARETNENDYIWVQDYHMALLASILKEMNVKRTLGYFLHIPFPPLDMFLKLPWRKEILEGLLGYELVGFQTSRDRRNFLQCVRALISGTRTSGRGAVVEITTPDTKLRAGSFPISIDYRDFNTRAKSKNVADAAWHIHERLPGRKLILGIDRLDYSKGIPERIRAIEYALTKYPSLKEKITYIQVVVPSRTEVPEYQNLKAEIERLVGEVNGKFTAPGWTPIHYIFGSLSQEQLLGYYRTCEIALITPLKDGMNLVAKEYCASSVEDNGVLILSEFAGAAAQLNCGAILVNPFDTEGVADAIFKAFNMEKQERNRRMRTLRRSIARADIFRWVDDYLRAAIAKDLSEIYGEDDEMPVSMAVQTI